MAFKTMEWIRAVRDAGYEATKNMTPEQRIAYIRKKAAAFRRALKRRAAKGPRDLAGGGAATSSAAAQSPDRRGFRGKQRRSPPG